ncbi:hypothetical protein H8A95_21980 [Bradyrhizobium sp. Pear76]|uniref:hypothetical protein n=1 Tax=Bradyrhizobium oropedii TaxID=1571201 RepID=UPI001E2E9575|nr:hypothetical protein [Bradyrhizobium oropedii]MCC8964908.1 hypothetical protein [Bradyrhizobium oropedii]
MPRTVAFGLFALLISVTAAPAADFIQSPGDLYQKPLYGGLPGVPNPTQVDPANSYIPITQFRPLANGVGTAEFSGWARTADLIAASPAASPAFASLQQRLDTAISQIQQTQRGIAATAAMANIWMPSAPGRTAWAINGAAFMSELGAGFSVAHRLNLSIPLAVTASYGNGGSSVHVGRIGLMGEF